MTACLEVNLRNLSKDSEGRITVEQVVEAVDSWLMQLKMASLIEAQAADEARRNVKLNVPRDRTARTNLGDKGTCWTCGGSGENSKSKVCRVCGGSGRNK
jgi:hypothetical protein